MFCFLCPEKRNSRTVFAYDLDHTLLKPLQGRTFARDANDAELAFPEVTQRLNQHRIEGHHIVIFTNQSGISKGTVNRADILNKIHRLLGNGIDICITEGNKQYRKPAPSLWEEWKKQRGYDMDEEFKGVYVGDAAGRKEDFSASDIQFAHNIHFDFYTPEAWFQKKNSEGILPPSPFEGVEPIPLSPSDLPERVLVLMVGMQGSGKSYWTKQAQEERKAVIVSNDIQGTKARARKQMELYMKAKEPFIIVDNTHATHESRAYFAQKAQEYDYPVHIVWVQTPRECCIYLKEYRSYKNNQPSVPMIALHSYRRNFQEPVESLVVKKIWPYIPDFDRNELNRYSF